MMSVHDRVITSCTKCSKDKNPTKGYLNLCKKSNQPYVCRECLLKAPTPPINLGKLGQM